MLKKRVNTFMPFQISGAKILNLFLPTITKNQVFINKAIF